MTLLRVSGFSHGRLKAAATILALIGALALAGCGKKQDGQAVIGQVIAHVGPDDVTQQEVDNEFRLANVPADKRTDAAMKTMLSRVVERKYLVQQAIAAKLDREPTVHLDLLRSREQILAGAYVQRELGAKVSGISKSDIDGYIQAHPEKFNKRQVFDIEQISFPLVSNIDQLAGATKDFKTMEQVEAKLSELGVKFSRGPAALDSVTMPPQMLKALQARNPDDVFFVRSRNSASFFKVTSVEDKPLSGDDAQNLGRREVANEMARKAAEDTSKAALASAKFEGDYGRIMTAAAPATPGAETAPGEAATGGEKPADEHEKDAPKN